MDRDRAGPFGPRLEGLVLRDGQGIFYEVPCVVIERYRVSVERAAELSARKDVASSAGERTDGGALAWSIAEGVYADERVDAAWRHS